MYRMVLTGLAVMAQLPVEQPTRAYQNDEMIEETLWLERLHEMTQEP